MVLNIVLNLVLNSISSIICSMLIIKKLASIMILQKVIAISFEGRHSVLTLLASNLLYYLINWTNKTRHVISFRKFYKMSHLCFSQSSINRYCLTYVFFFIWLFNPYDHRDNPQLAFFSNLVRYSISYNDSNLSES